MFEYVFRIECDISLYIDTFDMNTGVEKNIYIKNYTP